MADFINSNKLQNHLKVLNYWREGKIVHPITVEIHPAGGCNHRCYYCSAAQYHNTKTMTKKQLKITIDRLRWMGVKGLIYSGGGEPLVNKFTSESILYAVDSGLEIGFITNGALINKEIAEILLKKCVWIRVSFDAAKRKTFMKIRGVDDYDKVLRNIKLLLKTKKRLNVKTIIGVQAVINKYNVKEIVDFYNLWHGDLKMIDYIQIRPMELTKKALPYAKETMTQLRSLPKNDCRLIISDKFKIATMKKYPCLGYQFIGAVDVDGDMYLCCHTIGYEYARYGNVFKDEDWKRNRWARRRRKAFENIDYKNCPYSCRGSGINCYLNRIKDLHPHLNFL